MNRAVRAAWPLLTIAVALVVSIAVTAAGGGGSSARLVARAGILTIVPLAVAAVLGVLLATVPLPEADVRRGRLLDGAAVAAALWAIGAGVNAFLLYLDEAPAMTSAAFGPGLISFVTDVSIGRTWLIAAVCGVVLSTLLVAIRSHAGVARLVVLTVVAVVPIALLSASPGASIGVERTVAAGAFVQLLALATWIGVLAIGGSPTSPVRRSIPVGCFAALVGALGASWPVLQAQGAGTPVALSGGSAVLLAGLLAVVARLTGTQAFRGLQLVLLAAGLGLGVAASVMQPPPEVSARTTPAEILTGAPLPPGPSFTSLLGSWQPDAVWIVVCGALLAWYGASALRAPGWPVRRSLLWVLGVLLLAWLTSGGPAVYQAVLVDVHVLQHLGLLLVVPLLLAGGAPRLLLASGRGALDSPAVRLLTRPVAAASSATVVVLVLYGSVGVLRWSVSDALGTEVVTVACLLAGGLLVDAFSARGLRRRQGIAVVAALLVVETGGALALALSPSLLLADWFGAMGWGTDALVSQQRAAGLAWLVAVIPTAVLGAVVLRARGTSAPLARPESVAR